MWARLATGKLGVAHPVPARKPLTTVLVSQVV
jgi:hypothetical protein